jgi:hypothetical protein
VVVLVNIILIPEASTMAVCISMYFSKQKSLPYLLKSNLTQHNPCYTVARILLLWEHHVVPTPNPNFIILLLFNSK